MPALPPDPLAAAQLEAQQIKANPAMCFEGPLDRLLADNPHLDRDALVTGVETFHKERMAKTPPITQYPEAPAWVEFVRARDRHLVALTGINQQQLAVYRSLGAFVPFRAHAAFREQTVEKCRVAFIPDTDRGTLHIKNMDDLAAGWKRRPPFAAFPKPGLVWDGVGSGLHIDDEPPEIFPLPAREMCMACCDDVPGAVEFLSRYKYFWGKANVVLYDAAKRSVAIEKCSYNHIAVYPPGAGADGRSHVSGVTCRDPKSTIGRYQQTKRDQYRRLTGAPDDGPDAAFWRVAHELERKLAAFLASPGRLSSDAVIQLFVTPRPHGLNKCAAKAHPQQRLVQYTLCTTAIFLDERSILRWQRPETDLSWPAKPESYRFN